MFNTNGDKQFVCNCSILEQLHTIHYYFADEEEIAEELKPLKISHKLRETSNKPPGIARRTPTLLPKSSKIVPAIKIAYPTNPQIENMRETIFDLYNTETNNNPPSPQMAIPI